VLTDTAKVPEQVGELDLFKLNRYDHMNLPVTVPARGFNCFVIE